MVYSAEGNARKMNFLICSPPPPYVPSTTCFTGQYFSAGLVPPGQPNPVFLARFSSPAQYPVSRLKPAGLISESGVLAGLCLESPSGEVMNIVVNSSGFPGNIIYRGTYSGINDGVMCASLLGYQATLCWMKRPTTRFDELVASMPPECRKVDLQVHYVDLHPSEGRLHVGFELQAEWMMIVFPRDPVDAGLAQPGFDPAKQPPVIFEEVFWDHLRGTVHRVGRLL